MPRPEPTGELARTKSIELSETWPTMFEIVAYWGSPDAPRRKRTSIEITGDQFFGHGDYGAPLNGDQLIGMIDRLRRQGPRGPKS